MKIQALHQSKQQNFNGIKALPKVAIRNAADAISQWGKLSDRAYTLLGSTPEEEAVNFIVRKENFSFLDKLTSDQDKFTFIEEFKRVTGFPDLSEVSQKIKNQFKDLLKIGQKFMKENVSEVSAKGGNAVFDIAVAGYNPNCSVGLYKALPGSNLNDAFVLYNTSHQPMSPELGSIRRTFLDKIQDSSDHRILSFNHKYSRPVVMDVKEYQAMVGEMDAITEPFLSQHYNALLNKRMGFEQFNPQNLDGSNPSIFNLFLAANTNSKIAAHDTSIITEGIRDGIRVVENGEYMPDICNRMNKSFFSWCTNMLQTHGLEQAIGSSEVPYRSKIVARNVLNDFDKWPVKKQYDCVKTVVRNISDDNPVNSEFAGLLKDSDPTIENSIDALKGLMLIG